MKSRIHFITTTENPKLYSNLNYRKISIKIHTHTHTPSPLFPSALRDNDARVSDHMTPQVTCGWFSTCDSEDGSRDGRHQLAGPDLPQFSRRSDSDLEGQRGRCRLQRWYAIWFNHREQTPERAVCVLRSPIVNLLIGCG